MFELDHAFLWCRPRAPEAVVLERAGLRAGRRRVHPGQGTANACYFFGDAMLELIWIADEREVRSAPARLGLRERAGWRETGASPIGIAVSGVGPPPFEAWSYAPPFLPEGMALAVSDRSDEVGEPLLFAVPQRSPPAETRHPFADKRVTRATVTVAGMSPESTLRDLTLRNVGFRAGEGHSLFIELEGEAEGGALDFRPELPLVLRW